MRARRSGVTTFAGWATAALLLLPLAGGCRHEEESRIAWEPDRRMPGEMPPGTSIVLTEDGVPAVRGGWQPLRWPDDSTACPNTMVAVPAVGDAAFAVWRSRAAGGATSVLFARSPNGMLWQEPATAARFPAGTSGCGDPPVAIAVDAANGAVHLAIVASTTSAGLIFLAESRDGGATFSAPARALVAERRGPVAIAALGDTLAVVYLEGARERPAVSLALSSHKGEIPAVVGAVSPEDNRPFAPAVALRDGRIAIAWNEPRGATRPASAVARVGRIVR